MLPGTQDIAVRYEQENMKINDPRELPPKEPPPSQLPEPTKGLKHKRVPTGKKEAQTGGPVAEEDAPGRPAKRKRTTPSRPPSQLTAGVQSPEPGASSSRCTRARARVTSASNVVPLLTPEDAPTKRRPAIGHGRTAVDLEPKTKTDQVRFTQQSPLAPNPSPTVLEINTKPVTAPIPPPFYRRQLKTCNTIEEMVSEMERREKRVAVWSKRYRATGRTIRSEYDYYQNEQLEWVMCAAIKYHRRWNEITAEYAKAFPEANPRTKHSLYSKWTRQLDREEVLRQNDPSKAPKRPGHDEVGPPAKRKTSIKKKNMISRAQELARSRQVMRPASSADVVTGELPKGTIPS